MIHKKEKARVVSIVLIIAFILVSLFLLPQQLSAQSSTAFRPDPLEITIGLGQVEAVQIVIENVKNLYGAEMHLRFDPTVVEVVDADPNKDGIQVSPGDFLKPDFIAVNKADNKAGTIDLAFTELNPTPPANGSGVFATIAFRGKTLGKTTKLTSKGNILAVITGAQKVVAAPFKWEDGSITIVNPKPPTPTATLNVTPTRAATPTLEVTTTATPQVASDSSAGNNSVWDALFILIGLAGCLGAIAILAVVGFLVIRRSAKSVASNSQR